LKKLLLTLVFIIIIGVVPVLGDYSYYDEDNGDEIWYIAASALVMDAITGEILYERDGFTPRYPASITKVMTSLLVLEHIEDLSAPLTFSAHAIDIPYYASRMWVVEGETITVLEGLYGNMLPSGNEVSRALAELVSGSVPDFVALMNRRAVELGAYHTNFVNPCGLPGHGQFTTAYDISLIMREAIRHPIFVDIISTAYFNIAPTAFSPDGRTIRNTNRMIRPAEDEFNEYVIGGKTGFTNAAQHTLVTYAQRGDYTFIIATLFAPHWRYTFADTAALIDHAYEIMQERAIAEAEAYQPEAEEEIYEPVYIEAYDDEIETYIEAYDEVIEIFLQQNPNDLSDTEAFTVAVMSLGLVAIALLFIWWFWKKVSIR